MIFKIELLNQPPPAVPKIIASWGDGSVDNRREKSLAAIAESHNERESYPWTGD